MLRRRSEKNKIIIANVQMSHESKHLEKKAYQ